jgi:hypothetical protein
MSAELTPVQKSLNVILSVKKEIDAIGAQCKLIKIKDDLTLAIAQQNLSKANQMANFVEEKRVLIKQPHWDNCVTIDNTAKSITKELKEGMDHIKKEVKAYETLKQAEDKALQNKIDADLAAEKAKLAALPLTDDVVEKFNQLQTSAQASKEILSVGKTRGIRHVWKFELVDKSQLPPEWITIDEEAVKEWMKENKDGLTESVVNGVKFYKDISVVA